LVHWAFRAGKSTIAHAVEKRLFEMGVDVFAFDGDNVRHGLCGDLDFSPEDRAENTRRIAEMSKLFTENGTVSLCAFISPMQSDRDKVRQIVGEKDFHEIYVSCPVEVCEKRDVKGYYRKARRGNQKLYWYFRAL
jgi:adenylylsulfate kinase